MSNEIHPTIVQAAQPAAAADGATPGGQAIDALSKDGNALLVSDPSNPHHALYQQALQALELMGPQRFKDRRELERVAQFIAMQAGAIGLSRIDRIVASDDGAGYFFVDEQAVDPAMRGYVAHVEAIRPLDRQSLEQAQQQRATQEQQRRQAELEQQAKAETRPRASDPPSKLL